VSTIGITHVTGSGSEYPMKVYHKVIKPEEIILLEGNKADYCVGCSNHEKNGGCAWCAPDFNKLAKNYPLFHIISLQSTYDTILKFEKMAIFHRLSNLERLTANIMNKLAAKYIESVTEKSYLISQGNCRSCRSKGCVVADGEKCVHPTRRRYSLEATGINVVKTVKKQLDIKLLWYERGTGVLPDHMTRVAGILTNMTIEECNEAIEETVRSLYGGKE